jgi:hypothetical protein
MPSFETVARIVETLNEQLKAAGWMDEAGNLTLPEEEEQ